MRSTFKLLFYVNRQKIRTNGLCPIMGRITIDGKVAQYATEIEVSLDNWNVKSSRTNNREINRRLDELESKAQRAYRTSIDTAGYVSAEIVRNVVTDRIKTGETLLALFDEHNMECGKQVIRQTAVRYGTARGHLAEFLRYKYNVADIALRSIDRQLIVDFDFYLSTVLNLKCNTRNLYISILRKVMRLAVKQKALLRDPFEGYKSEKPIKQYHHLTAEQLTAVMRAELPVALDCTRDLFLFSCFTGIGAGDLSKLTSDNITTDTQGAKWLRFARSKTGVECVIKLLDLPARIIEKWRGDSGLLFDVPAPHILGGHLRAIAEAAGLGISLTFYMARHTFATVVCLENGVPIETISKMLGHTSIRTTQVYAEISNQKVAQDFRALAQSANQKYKLNNQQH